MPAATAQAALRLWEANEEITFLATVRQDLGDSGSIISLSSPLYRWVHAWSLFLSSLQVFSCLMLLERGEAREGRERKKVHRPTYIVHRYRGLWAIGKYIGHSTHV